MDLFVVGTSRSGSTMTRDLLGLHPDVAILNESHWLPWLHHFFGLGPAPLDAMIDVVQRTHWDSGRPVIDVNVELAGCDWQEVRTGLRRALGTMATIGDFHDEIVRLVFGKTDEAALLADKTPDYGFYMCLLQRIWPHARFVHVVRGGLDTALSMSRHRGLRLQVAAGFDNWCPLAYGGLSTHIEDRPAPLGAFVATWRRRIDRIRDEATRLRPGTYMEIHYESMLDDPVGALTELSAFAGLAETELWIREAAGLPKRRHGAVDASVLAELSIADLRCLNEVDGEHHLLLPFDADSTMAGSLLRRGEQSLATGHPDHALLCGLSVLATAVSESDDSVRGDAVALLATAAAPLGVSIETLMADIDVMPR